MSGTKNDSEKQPARFMYLTPIAVLNGDGKTYRMAHHIEDIIKDLTKGNVELELFSVLEMSLVSSLREENDTEMCEIIKNVSYVSKLGADKYGIYNYQKGMDWSRLMDALCRHFIHYLYGDLIDIESGKDHRYHILANIYMLTYFIKVGVGKNDLIEESVDEQ